ncbi:DNA polymerase II small subunit [Methanococcoides vulcani]|uniref:DNA polymerase II small subunit n=1 Tax=Methanococcoides vulcani TaxID=1353158 RepID=A0A1I0AU36_9EURY|nr:DNA-directed DNA polymerase II small subunit [Methanococcoides vulcani]SES97923.1 DNA polymerase II small subunit [Methanococcoides vulcani]
MKEINVQEAFLEAGYQISPEAVKLIVSHSSPKDLVCYILEHIDESVFVIEIEHIDLPSFESEYPTSQKADSGTTSEASSHPGSQISQNSEVTSVEAPVNPVVSASPSFSSPSGYGTDRSLNTSIHANSNSKGNVNGNNISIMSDITDMSTCVGEYMEFVQYFRNRYSKLSDMIRGRITARPIESLNRNRKHGGGLKRSGGGDYSEVSIIGMVSEVRSTANGHKMLQLEDPTGSFLVLVHQAEKDLFEEASKIILDEVIGITGSLTNDGSLIVAKKIILPDLPNISHRREGTWGKAVFTSDVHIGSSTFLEEEWCSFLDFLNGKCDNDQMKELSKDIRFLVIAGDLVDGIGIFPGQEHELDILDIYDQYAKAAEYFSQVPEHIQIIISPGNHDAVRQAEPQPRFPERITSLFEDRITFVGNPALVDLDGVQVLMYHGRSIDDLVASIPGVSYQEPEKAMIEMLKRRHLSPIYGSRVSIAPEKQDHFVIDPIPDILHCGHVHTIGIGRYKNVLAINSGTWQSQTEFQKMVNVMPTPAQVPIVDLSTLRTTLLHF